MTSLTLEQLTMAKDVLVRVRAIAAQNLLVPIPADAVDDLLSLVGDAITRQAVADGSDAAEELIQDANKWRQFQADGIHFVKVHESLLAQLLSDGWSTPVRVRVKERDRNELVLDLLGAGEQRRANGTALHSEQSSRPVLFSAERMHATRERGLRPPR